MTARNTRVRGDIGVAPPIPGLRIPPGARDAPKAAAPRKGAPWQPWPAPAVEPAGWAVPWGEAYLAALGVRGAAARELLEAALGDGGPADPADLPPRLEAALARLGPAASQGGASTPPRELRGDMPSQDVSPPWSSAARRSLPALAAGMVLMLAALLGASV